MSRPKRTVTHTKKLRTDRLPEWANEGAVLVQWLHESCVLDEIADRLRIQREGGYVGVDLVLFVLFFLTAKLDGGIKGFGEHSKEHREQLGALGGRRVIPTPTSVSRILGATDRSHSEALSEWLLFDACGADAVSRHGSSVARDALGAAWHVFDLDPTTTVLRQRALPDTEDLPPPERRSKEQRLGYTGRKRGDVQISRMTLQHAGSALWMGLWMAPGNGEWREHSTAAVRRVRAICDRMDHPGDHALVRVDGAGGNVPFLTACQEAGVRCLTRWSQYEILDEPEIRLQLNAASWFAVADSGTGPRREAAEVGWVWLHPHEETLRTDGGRFEPVRARLVVSRFTPRNRDKKRGAGTLIDGWQYELYVTDLSADAWPAPDIVTTYYGRCGQENRFYQEDQEIGLDQIFSYHEPGQQLANLVGLFLWNLRVCRGFELAQVPAAVPPQPPYVAKPVDPGALLVVDAPVPRELNLDGVSSVSAAPSDPICLEDPGTFDVVAALPPEIEPPPSRTAIEEPEGAVLPELADTTLGEPLAARVEPASVMTRHEAREALRMELNALDWSRFLEDKPGWRWDDQEGLVCPNNERHPMRSVKIQGKDRTRQLRFSAPFRACSECTLRALCTLSQDPLYRKETAITVPSSSAYRIHELLQLRRAHAPPPLPAPPPPPRPSPPPRPPRAQKPTPPPAAPKPSPRPWEPSWRPAGPHAVTPAPLQPATLRRTFARVHRALEVHVQVHLPAERPTPAMFACTAAERQNRRLTWTERWIWNALPENSHVKIEFAGGERLRTLLQPKLDGRSAQEAA